MDRRQDKDLTLADFKKWVERKFEDLEKKIVTDVQGATGQTDVSSAGVARWDLMEENPSSDYYDSQRESTSAHVSCEKGQFEKEASKPLKIIEPGDFSIQQMLLEILDRQQKVERQISTLEKEKRFMRDELQNAQRDIIKRLENIKCQTTHFENRFHELAEKLENKVEETRTITENQTSKCVGVMSQTVRDMTSKVVQEIKTVQAFVQQCQLSPNKQDLNIPDLKVLMGEVLKDFLHPIEKAVENQGQLEKLGSLAIKQEVEQLNIKLDGLSSKLTDQEAADTERSENCSKQIVVTINEECKDLEKSINNIQQELQESNQSSQENIKSQMIQSVTQMTEQIQKSENSIKTKQAQNLEDTEKRIVKNTNTVIASLEENLTHQNQEREYQLKTHVAEQIQTSKQSLESKLSQNLRDSETRITGNINAVISRLEGNLTHQNQGREYQLKKHVADQIQTSKQSLETKLSQNLRDSETRITGNINAVTARLEENMTHQSQGREDQLKTHVAEHIQTSKQSLETKLSQNLRDSETRITGNINTVIDRLEENLTQQNQGREDQLKIHIAEQIQTFKQSLETKLSQNLRDLEKSINNVQQELQESNQSSQENIKLQIIQSVKQMTGQIQKSENSVMTKQAQNLEDTEIRIVESTNTVITWMQENNLNHQNQRREDQLKTHVAQQIQTSKQSLETKLSQNLRDSETRITGNINTVIDRLEENLTQQNQGREDQLKIHIAEQIQTSKQSLETKLSQNLRDSETRIIENINTVTECLEENLTEQIQKSENETIQQIEQANNESSQSTKTEIQTNLKTNTETMKDFMTCVKRELFKFIEKESSITRIKITDPTTQVRSSTFDFYVKNFKGLVKSGKDVYSVPWYIDEFKSSVEGNVYFKPNGDIEVWLIHGRYHFEMGLQPRRVKLSVRATVTDRSGVLPDLLVGEETSDWKEEDVRNNGDWGTALGTLKCQDVIQKGYHKCGGYLFDSVLVRYHIDVV